MDVAKKLVSKSWLQFKQDLLFRNSIFLMLSSVLTAASGFIFWLLAARYFTSEQVGIASALVSATMLIASFSLFGINAAFIRYLANHPDRNAFMGRGIVITSVAALVVTAIYVSVVSLANTSLPVAFGGTAFLLLFMISAYVSAVNMVTDSIFIALQAAKFILLENLLLSVTRVVAPLFVQGMSAEALFFANIVGVIVALVVTAVILLLHYKFFFSRKILTRLNPERTKFALSNYFMSIFVSGPLLLYPTVIIIQAGAKAAGYYYLASMVANVLAIIPLSIGQSLFADVSRDMSNLRSSLTKAVKLLAVLLIPSVAVACIAVPLLFRAFYDPEYQAAIPLLRLLLISVFFGAINQITIVVFRALGYMKELVIISIVVMLVAVALVYWWAPISVTAIGYAWLVANAFGSVLYLLLIAKHIKRKRANHV